MKFRILWVGLVLTCMTAHANKLLDFKASVLGLISNRLSQEVFKQDVQCESLDDCRELFHQANHLSLLGSLFTPDISGRTLKNQIQGLMDGYQFIERAHDLGGLKRDYAALINHFFKTNPVYFIYKTKDMRKLLPLQCEPNLIECRRRIERFVSSNEAVLISPNRNLWQDLVFTGQLFLEDQKAIGYAQRVRNEKVAYAHGLLKVYEVAVLTHVVEDPSFEQSIEP